MFILASVMLGMFLDVAGQVQSYAEVAGIISAAILGTIGGLKAVQQKNKSKASKSKPKQPKRVAPLSQDDVDEIGARR